MKNPLPFAERIKIRIAASPEELLSVQEIREEVFVQEQGIPLELENDGQDENSEHLMVVYDQRPVGTGRLIAKSAEEANLSRVAVLAPFCGLGLGKMVIRELENLAWRSGIKRVFLFPHFYLEDFYAGLGYRKAPDTRQVGPHRLIKMTKDLTSPKA
ncbi:MAG: GNAT family N-acetyltransferase [Syntrophomonadaceae bacterium]|nr:GNAT family N-acetyltransferase [Syntrophomonadaceae bacterium]